jgi:hydroxymethylglutaryl-CoA lyase
MKEIKIIECPRDAMQGLKEFIPTEQKISYINKLLTCNFDTIDAGSFVSPKAIPQMADTVEVLKNIDLRNTSSKLLTIVANERGAAEACTFEQVSYLGYPFSVSETFQQRNTNASIEESLVRVEAIQNLAVNANKKLVVYLSMGFGNPYGDAWSPELLVNWSQRLSSEFGIEILALSDTIGCATEELVKKAFSELIPALPAVEFGAHLHTTPEKARAIVLAALEGGCSRFDGAIKGFGGCPMAKDDLTGNMPTEILLSTLDGKGYNHGVNTSNFEEAMALAQQVFPTTHAV